MKILLTGAMFALSVAAAPAAATIVDVTYSGTVAYGFDYNGVFGSVRSNLTGLKMQTHYVFDTTLGDVIVSPTKNVAEGGLHTGTMSPVISADVTLDGFTVQLAGQYNGMISGYNYGNMSEQFHDAEDRYIVGGRYYQESTYAYIFNRYAAMPASITQSFTHKVGPSDDRALGFYNLYSYDVGTFANSLNTGVGFWVDTLTVKGVPEPATWTLMIAGFGMVGASMRRRSIATA